jgi:hypothetical protein
MVVGASALLIATTALSGTGWAADAPQLAPGVSTAKGTPTTPASRTPQWAGSHLSSRTLPKQVVTYTGTSAPRSLHRMTARPDVTSPVTAQINVTYVGFPTAARNAFQAAVDIWERQIRSAVPIDVTADWSDLAASIDPNVLGAAGPVNFVENFPNAPRPGVYYPIALANAISGQDLAPANFCTSSGMDPSQPDISASFNSRPPVPWYFGTDGNTPSGMVDLESVVLHELGHGLGFIGSYDGINPTTGLEDVPGRGYYGLSGQGTDTTIFDQFVGDIAGNPLGSGPYTNGTTMLGTALRTAVTWTGANGIAGDGGQRPRLYAPSPWQPGSSFSHLDQNIYSGTANTLMTPALPAGVSAHSVGPIVLGMFKDMGWPVSAAAPAVGLGSYHPAALSPQARLFARQGATSAQPLNITVAGRFGVPSDPAAVRAVAVNIEVKNPNAAGYTGALPGCAVGPGRPDAGDYRAGQSREWFATLPVDGNGNIMVSLSRGAAEVNVDLLGWYAAGGTYYHHLQDQKVAVRTTVSAGHPVDVSVLGKAGIPTSGVTAVVFKTRVSGTAVPSYLALGPGGVTSHVPTITVGRGEMLSNLTTVQLGTGASAGKVRLRLTSGTGLISLEAVGWYGPSSAGGQFFHPSGPARYQVPLRGNELLLPGLPGNSQVMLAVHLANPTANGWIGSAPGGHPTLHGIQEYAAGQPTSGTIIATTNTAGALRLHLSAGISTVYVDFLGWFAST